MGGSSTSHSAVLGSQRAKSSSAFDLHSWQGLTQLLRLGKESIQEASEYAEFRNLVLEYAQKGGDAELRKKIDTIIAHFSDPSDKSLLEVKEHAEKKETAHTSPSQARVHRNQNITQEAKKIPVTTHTDLPSFVKESKVTGDTVPVSNASVASGKTPQSSFDIRRSRLSPRFASFEESNGAVVNEMLSAVHEEKTDDSNEQGSIEVDTQSKTKIGDAISSSPVFKTLEEHKVRITEIKRLVHEHMGNPAALLDTHNDLGKKYMTALLSALKATGAGSTEGVDGAMMRLESAFTALQNDVRKIESQPVKNELPKIELENEQVVEDVSVSSPTSEPSVPVVDAVENVELRETAREEDESEAHDVPEETTPWSSRDVPATFEKSDEKISSAVKAMHENTRGAPRTLTSLLTHEEEVVEDALRGHAPVILKKYEDEKVPTLKDSVPEPISTPSVATESHAKYTFKGIGKTHDGEGVAHESAVNPNEVASRQSELFSPHINQALHQLLQDWNIFGSSGIFGIGPGGAEHPLYETLAPLSMGEVLAGRWEKADHKIVKIIKQYVDAWHHEQGVAYTPNETFDHYLRRVIQKILKRQNIE